MEYQLTWSPFAWVGLEVDDRRIDKKYINQFANTPSLAETGRKM